jgi:hypothetical protein
MEMTRMEKKALQVLVGAFLMMLSLLLPACGGGGYAAKNPQCDALCKIEEPSLEGAYNICSTASADSCKELCDLRIDGQTSLCTSCLLEKAKYGSDQVKQNSACATQTPSSCGSGALCTESHSGTSCSWCENDQAAHDNCMRTLFPRTEIDCDVEFRPVSDCASFCD